MDNYRPKLDDSGAPADIDIAEMKVQPSDNQNMQQPKSSMKKTLVVVVLSIAVVVTIAATWFSSANHTNDKSDNEITAESVEPVSPVATLLGDHGTVIMEGTFGAAQSSITLNFKDATGTRHYISAPSDIYNLRIDSAEACEDGDYRLTITDMLDGRIPIGKYSGIYNGTTFTGTYNSNHGKVRQFKFEI